jgi:hypothetical protein
LSRSARVAYVVGRRFPLDTLLRIPQYMRNLRLSDQVPLIDLVNEIGSPAYGFGLCLRERRCLLLKRVPAPRMSRPVARKLRVWMPGRDLRANHLV